MISFRQGHNKYLIVTNIKRMSCPAARTTPYLPRTRLKCACSLRSEGTYHGKRPLVILPKLGHLYVYFPQMIETLSKSQIDTLCGKLIFRQGRVADTFRIYNYKKKKKKNYKYSKYSSAPGPQPNDRDTGTTLQHRASSRGAFSHNKFAEPRNK